MVRFILLLVTSCLVFAADKAPAHPPLGRYEEAILKFKQAREKALIGSALDALQSAIAINPKRLDAYFYRAEIFSVQNKFPEAIADYTKVIELDPKASTAYDKRGWEELKLGHMDRAIQDFDRYIALEPGHEPYHWQRGIAYYYAGKYEQGRKQFEMYHTVKAHDVENGVWHFMCVARASGFDKAREMMLPVSGDARVPMTEIYELFRGKATPNDVIKATQKGEPDKRELDTRRFYAELYLGLYFEAKGEGAQAYDHTKRAATAFRADHLMGDVVRMHFKRLLAPSTAK